MTINKGTVFIISKGAYSAYTVVSLAKALCDIETETISSQYLTQFPDEAEDMHYSKFILWMTDKGLIEETTYGELFLGEYDELAPDFTEYLPRDPED